MMQGPKPRRGGRDSFIAVGHPPEQRRDFNWGGP